MTKRLTIQRVEEFTEDAGFVDGKNVVDLPGQATVEMGFGDSFLHKVGQQVHVTVSVPHEGQVIADTEP